MSVTCPSTEPAVPAFNRPLFTGPVEVVVMIISHIEKHCDLWSLAHVSKVFYDIIVPEWLDYIHIRCDPLRIDIWQSITSQPHLGARTRTLELINERVASEHYSWSACKAIPYCQDFDNCNSITSFPYIIPSFSPEYLNLPIKREVYEKSVLALADALKHMTRLRCFRWGSELPVAYAFEPLFNSFGQRNDMDEFYFDLGDDVWGLPLIHDDKLTVVNLPPISPLGKFCNITTFCLTIDNVPWHHESDSLVDWIIQFTTLKHLQLNFLPKPGNFDFLVIWQRAHWPSLVELTLEADIKLFPEFPAFGDYFHNPNEESPFTTFLHNHQTIQRLQIRTLKNYSGFIQPQTLSRLRSLVLGFKSHVGPFRNGFPLDIAQQIEYLECSISAECLPTLQAMTSLRVFNALCMDLEVFERFVEAAPHIQHLHIPYAMWYNSSLIEPCHLADRLVSCLFKLNHLVRLEGKFVVNERCDLFQTQYLISKIMEHTSLVYIDSLTREQWNLALKEAAVRERFEIHLPCVTIPDIKEYAGFYIKNCEK
ncbi:hypothetical protein BU17DRAFT_68072 [Hysterangium stoloniferum]|nr:hypothetical protein BU17DRAFT_68072 [Hysterangium stoloniferum]